MKGSMFCLGQKPFGSPISPIPHGKEDGGELDAAIAKLLWLLVFVTYKTADICVRQAELEKW